MQLDRQAKATRRCKQAVDLGGGKGDAFAKAINRINQPFGLGGMKRGNGNFGNIVIGAPAIFGRHGMGGQKAGADLYRTQVADGTGGAQHPQFRLDLQPIARLDLDHCHAFGQHRIDKGQGGGHQTRLGCRPSGPDGGQNATPGPRQFRITRPLQAQFKFRRAVAAVDHMSVAVDQRRGDQTPVHAMAGPVGIGQGQIAARPDPGDHPAVNHNGGIGNQPIGISAGPHRRGRQVGQDQGCRLHKAPSDWPIACRVSMRL